MSFGQFIQENWILVSLLVIVLIIIAIYEMMRSKNSAGSVSNIQASQLVNNGAYLIDVRTYAEFKKSHIAGAQNVTKEQFDDFLTKHQKKKDLSYVLYCQSGVSVKPLAEKMKNDGFNHVYVLKQGIDGWNQDNLPTV